MGKFRRTHITIKEEQIDRILKFLNRSNTMVNYIRNTHDVRLSDVRRLEEGMDELADMFHLYMPDYDHTCLLYTSPSPRDGLLSRMPSSA